MDEHCHLGKAVLRCRTTFYTALTHLLLVDLGEDEDEFELFMLPLTATFKTLTQLFNTNFKQDKVKCMLIGLSRDLRGIVFALNTKTSYTMLFDWLSQRLSFEVSSPNGILLFGEASKMISTYGNQILSLGNIPKDQVYPLKFKGISICFCALKAALCGNYVSFGVFQLYGDCHFNSALKAFLKMLLSICHSDLLAIGKKQEKKALRLRQVAQEGEQLLYTMQQSPEHLQQYFDELRSNLISNQGPEQQKALNACFEKLMEGVEQSLLIKNRDRFTQNVSVFKHEVTETLRISAATRNPVGTVHMMS